MVMEAGDLQNGGEASRKLYRAPSRTDTPGGRSILRRRSLNPFKATNDAWLGHTTCAALLVLRNPMHAHHALRERVERLVTPVDLASVIFKHAAVTIRVQGR
jgi:hypothetical protein